MQWWSVVAMLFFIEEAAMAIELDVQDTQFTLNGKPTFLLGISYYGALGAPKKFIKHDLDDMQRYGFNWIRVWATWRYDMSAVDAEGNIREPFMSKLKWLVEECDRRDMIVDVTLSRGRIKSQEGHIQAVKTLVKALKPYRNWYIDLANEHNLNEVSFEELKQLRDLVKELDPQRLVTASYTRDIGRDKLREYLFTVQVDFITPHRPRHAHSPQETESKTLQYLEMMKELRRVVPVHYQEPFRRGFRPNKWDPKAEDFLIDLKGAIDSGAAGWCFHNGDQRNHPEKKPRRSFDMRKRCLFEQLDEEEQKFLKKIRR